nr:TolC family protein [Pinirhizobacter soli]
MPAAYACAALIACSPSFARAAGSLPQPSEVAPAAVRDAARALWLSSPDVEAARAMLDAARARARAGALPVYNPQLQAGIQNADNQQRSVGVGITLDVTGKRKALTRQADAGLRVASAGYERSRRDVTLRWLKTSAAVNVASLARQVGERRVQVLERFDALAARQLAVGDVGPPERDLASLALAEARVDQAARLADEAAAVANLVAVAPVPAAPLHAVINAGRLPAPATEQAMIDTLPELAQARAQADASDAAVSVADRARRPDPTLSLVAGTSRAGRRNDSLIGLNVSIPLPVRNNGRDLVAAASAEAAAASAQVRALQMRTDADALAARTSYVALREAAAAVGGTRAAAFDDRVAILERLWQSGEITTSDYLLQLRQSLDTALSVTRLQGDAVQAWFDYLAASGQLMAWIGDNDGATE